MFNESRSKLNVNRKSLEYELSLDINDLRSHAWYHGKISRVKAEELITVSGQFLIRDCTSRPGDYVLSCLCNNLYLHFVINKIIMQPYTVYERVQYTFEDDSFDTIPDIITYYVGNKKAISQASGAIISEPVNRLLPLYLYNLENSNQNENEKQANRSSTHEEPPPKPTRGPCMLINTSLYSNVPPDGK